MVSNDQLKIQAIWHTNKRKWIVRGATEATNNACKAVGGYFDGRTFPSDPNFSFYKRKSKHIAKRWGVSTIEWLVVSEE